MLIVQGQEVQGPEQESRHTLLVSHHGLFCSLVVEYLQHLRKLWHHLDEGDVAVLVEVAYFSEIDDLRLIELEAQVTGVQDSDEVLCFNVPCT